MAADTLMKSMLKITSQSERHLLSQRVYFALDERILGFMKHMFKVLSSLFRQSREWRVISCIKTGSKTFPPDGTIKVDFTAETKL